MAKISASYMLLQDMSIFFKSKAMKIKVQYIICTPYIANNKINKIMKFI